MQLSQQQITSFRAAVWEYYTQSGRGSLPWRLPEPDGSFDPYKILVSELMLQQTQVGRVIPKYLAFLERFPTVETLAEASLADVLRLWQGLGYNRRAKYLWLAAQAVHGRSSFPDTVDELVTLPGVGKNTAGAILAYAYDRPVIFIETNVRTVFIHHFFAEQTAVHDSDIRDLVAHTLGIDHYREWYWALMDYGSYLKSTVGNVSRSSQHFVRQSGFQGSRRQVRGRVIRWLSERPYSKQQLLELAQDSRLEGVLQELAVEGLIREKPGGYSLD